MKRYLLIKVNQSLQATSRQNVTKFDKSGRFRLAYSDVILNFLILWISLTKYELKNCNHVIQDFKYLHGFVKFNTPQKYFWFKIFKKCHSPGRLWIPQSAFEFTWELWFYSILKHIINIGSNLDFQRSFKDL